MKVSIAYKNVKHSKAVEERIQEKSQHFDKYLDGKFEMKWVCNFNEGFYSVEFNLHGPHIHFMARAKNKNFYKCLDLVTDKVEKQVLKQKDRWKNPIHHKHDHRSLEFYDLEDAWNQHDEERFDDVDILKVA
jgi:ribosomal subunit interface protein